jgi:hypothetical protein
MHIKYLKTFLNEHVMCVEDLCNIHQYACVYVRMCKLMSFYIQVSCRKTHQLPPCKNFLKRCACSCFNAEMNMHSCFCSALIHSLCNYLHICTNGPGMFVCQTRDVAVSRSPVPRTWPWAHRSRPYILHTWQTLNNSRLRPVARHVRVAPGARGCGALA